MHVEPAALADIPALADLLTVLFTQEVEFVPDREAQIRGLTRIVDNPEIGCILVAMEQDRIVGMVNLLYTISTALGERVAILEDMVVAPSARGGGIGTRLLQAAIEHARSAGCKRITLLTDQSNGIAQQFYVKQGFSVSSMVPMRLAL